MKLITELWLYASLALGTFAFIVGAFYIAEALINRLVRSLRVFRTVLDFYFHRRAFAEWQEAREKEKSDG